MPEDKVIINIQEYGMAAPDPKDPDMVYGSQRGGVSLYNRKIQQSTTVGPVTESQLFVPWPSQTFHVSAAVASRISP